MLQSTVVVDPDTSENSGKGTLKLKVESGTAVLARAKRSALVDAANTEFEERAAGTLAAAPKGFERNAGAAWLEDETAERAEAQPPLVDMGDGPPLVDGEPKAELLNAEEKGLDMVWSRKATVTMSA